MEITVSGSAKEENKTRDMNKYMKEYYQKPGAKIKRSAYMTGYMEDIREYKKNPKIPASISLREYRKYHGIYLQYAIEHPEIHANMDIKDYRRIMSLSNLKHSKTFHNLTKDIKNGANIKELEKNPETEIKNIKYSVINFKKYHVNFPEREFGAKLEVLLKNNPSEILEKNLKDLVQDIFEERGELTIGRMLNIHQNTLWREAIEEFMLTKNYSKNGDGKYLFNQQTVQK